MTQQSKEYYKHRDFVESTIEKIYTDKENQKRHAIMLVDGIVINLEQYTPLSSYVCNKLCEIIEENPDFIDEILHHEPVRSRAWNGDFSKLTEDCRVARNLEDMLFYKSDFHGSPEYQKLTFSITAAREKLIL